MERMEELRKHALESTFNNAEWEYFYYKGYFEACPNKQAMPLRFAHASFSMLSRVEPIIDNNEIIVGKQSNRKLTEHEQTEFDKLTTYVAPILNSVASSAHMSLDYERILTKGVIGLRTEIEEKINALSPTDSEDMKKDIFYRSCLIALDGLLVFADKYATLATHQASVCSDAHRRKELLEIARICEKVPRYPAETFHEALQSCHFLLACISLFPFGLFQLGRPDRLFINYYRNDIAQNRLTQSEAMLLICCQCMMYNEIVPQSLAVGFMVGGKDATGKDTTNELTDMYLESIGITKLAYPGIGLAYNGDTPKKTLDIACDMLRQGHTHPAIFIDDTIIKGLKSLGVSEEDCYDYVQSTCVEITPGASSSCWVASPYINLVQVLLDVLGVKESEKPILYTSFEDLKQAFFDRLLHVIHENFRVQNEIMWERTQRFYMPLLSCFVRDCLEKGRDIESGGARYNWIMPSFVGVANIADSFGVIEERIFNKKDLTFEGLHQMLLTNYEGMEAERLRNLKKVDKYGNDIDHADQFVIEITNWLTEKCQGLINCRGGKHVPSLFCWIMHESLGSETLASPDGRTKGFPLGDGSGPAQGREYNGPTASLLSSTKWEQYPFIGGIAVNMKFGKQHFQDDSLDKLKSLIKTFANRGGFELQINVVDQSALLEAQKHPDLYTDLVVRIGGYSDYFVRLSPAMQAEVIQRTEHVL